MSQDLPVPLPEPSCVRSFYNDYKRAGAWHTKTSEPWSGTGAACGETEPMFTAEQMESYARACMAPLQERVRELENRNDDLHAALSMEKSSRGMQSDRIRELIADAERMRALETGVQRQNKLMHLAAQQVVFFGGFFYNPDDHQFRVPEAEVLCNDFFWLSGFPCGFLPCRVIV